MRPESIGWLLIGVGVLDLLVGLLIVAPRVPEGARRIVVTSIGAGAALVLAVGALFVAGVLGR